MSHTSTAVVGSWGNFEFKMVQPEDHPKILVHLKECLYYRAFYRTGYTRDMDPEMEAIFAHVLNDGHNLSFYAEDRATGKVAAARIITMEKTPKVGEFPPLTSRTCKGIIKFYYEILADCKLGERYPPSAMAAYPHMFGVSVDDSYCQQGLATESYKRAIGLMKERGFSFSVVGFVSPYSRAAGGKNGFIQLAKRSLLQAVDDEGQVLHPTADPEDFLDIGVFQIK